MDEQAIKQRLEENFSFLKDKVMITRPRRIFVDVPLENFKPVLEYAYSVLGFKALSAITGLDEVTRLAAMYHLAKAGIMLNLKVPIPRNDTRIDTITAYFPSADIFERELVDLFGIQVQGLAEGPRYPLTDDWPKNEFPLRKDWKSSYKQGAEEADHA
ncbi:MAG: NADH-quinone oxidoreductase subunit C [Candidatus Omnitrophica bacterium]|nr:NADH-quinone oxidoreductase subunit C [Candidatus Omnitrophota bacterium]MDD5610251.1 NADH-quinone oxidoreductase subunit C [Candidatus Omnitrophota bacterium]